MWGPHSFDRFASMMMCQLPQYNSCFDPLSSGVDALAQTNWKLHNIFVNCPFRMIPNVLNLLQHREAEATMIAPWWPGQHWFQQLVAMSITRPILPPMSKRAVRAISPSLRPEPRKNPHWRIFAWRVSGKTDLRT